MTVETLHKKIQNKKSLTEKEVKNILLDALTYHLIGSITFQKFLAFVNRVGERPEIRTMPEIEITTSQLLSLSQYASHPKKHRKDIIDIFNIVISNLLK